MNIMLDGSSLWILLPQVVVMAVCPPVIYYLSGKKDKVSAAGVRGRKGAALNRGIVLVAILAFLLMCGMLSLFEIGLAFSPHASEQLYDRLLSNGAGPLVAILIMLSVIVLPWLARRGTGTIGFWMFVIACAFPSYWLGLGGLPADLGQSWRIVATVSIVGALAGIVFAQIKPSVGPSGKAAGSAPGWRQLALWLGTGAAIPLASVLTGWSVGRAIAWNGWRTPYESNLVAILPVLAVALSIGLAAGILTGILTGLLAGRARWSVIPALALVLLILVGLYQASPKDKSPFKVLAAEAPASTVRSIAFTPDSSLIAAGLGPGESELEAGTLLVWRISDWSEVKRMTLSAGTPNLTFSPDGKALAIGSGNSVQLYRVADWAPLHTLPGAATGSGMAFSPDGLMLATASGNQVQLWNSQDWSLMRTLPVDQMTDGRSLAFAPDSRSIATGSSDWKIRLWSVADGSLLGTMDGHTKEVTAVAFSPDGRTIASTSWDDTMRLWQVSGGKLLYTFDKFPTTTVAFAPGSLQVAAGGSRSASQIWRVSDGVFLTRLSDPPNVSGGINAIAYSPDGKMVAGGADYQEVVVWNLP